MTDAAYHKTPNKLQTLISFIICSVSIPSNLVISKNHRILTTYTKFPFPSIIFIRVITANMGMTHSTARWVAPLSFGIDFAAQQYGMLSSPNMKDINDKNLSFWSPQPFAIAGFFFPQQIFQGMLIMVSFNGCGFQLIEQNSHLAVQTL